MPFTPDTSELLSQRLFTLPNEEATEKFGRCFARALRASYIDHAPADGRGLSSLQIHLMGELGAGKTALTRATLRALGHTGRVRSPTYTLVEPYTLMLSGKALNVYHFDLYRFSDPTEWADAGFREYFNEHALCLIEWPQQAGALLGTPDLALTLEVIPEGGRRLTAHAFSEIGKECLNQC